MRLVILNTYDEVSEWTATYIKDRIKKFNPTADKPFVLGLPTGNHKSFSTLSRCFLIRWHSVGYVQEIDRVPAQRRRIVQVRDYF